MDEALLEIRSYEGEGYKPLIDYGTWRVAILRFLDALHPGNLSTMERHLETDEVFVLTQGKGVLITGGNGRQIDRLDPHVMEIGQVYNIKRNAWHTTLLSRDGSVVIIENRDTGSHNSEYAELSSVQRQLIVEIADQAQIS